MDKKGMQLETVIKWIIVLFVLLAVVFIFSTRFRSEVGQLKGIRESVSVSDFSLPNLGLDASKEKQPSGIKPTVKKEPACKSFFDLVQSAVDLNKLSELRDDQLHEAINGHESFLNLNKNDLECPRDYITQIEDNLAKLNAEKTKRSPTAQ